MPLYEFICNDCSDHFETLVRSFDAVKDVECEECHSSNVKRLMSTFAVAGMDDPITPRMSAGGGCCGGSCGCGH